MKLIKLICILQILSISVLFSSDKKDIYTEKHEKIKAIATKSITEVIPSLDFKSQCKDRILTLHQLIVPCLTYSGETILAHFNTNAFGINFGTSKSKNILGKQGEIKNNSTKKIKNLTQENKLFKIEAKTNFENFKVHDIERLNRNDLVKLVSYIGTLLLKAKNSHDLFEKTISLSGICKNPLDLMKKTSFLNQVMVSMSGELMKNAFTDYEMKGVPLNFLDDTVRMDHLKKITLLKHMENDEKNKNELFQSLNNAIERLNKKLSSEVDENENKTFKQFENIILSKQVQSLSEPLILFEDLKKLKEELKEYQEKYNTCTFLDFMKFCQTDYKTRYDMSGRNFKKLQEVLYVSENTEIKKMYESFCGWSNKQNNNNNIYFDSPLSQGVSGTSFSKEHKIIEENYNNRKNNSNIERQDIRLEKQENYEKKKLLGEIINQEREKKSSSNDNYIQIPKDLTGSIEFYQDTLKESEMLLNKLKIEEENDNNTNNEIFIPKRVENHTERYIQFVNIVENFEGKTLIDLKNAFCHAILTGEVDGTLSSNNLEILKDKNGKYFLSVRLSSKLRFIVEDYVEGKGFAYGDSNHYQEILGMK